LQQCAADLACSMNYSSVFQTKLDNVSNYMDLQVSNLRHQLNTTVQPLEVKVAMLERDTTTKVSTLFDHLRAVESELVYDRQFLGNLTRGLYILNDEYRKEALDRSHDVHQLELGISQTKNSMTQLQDAVNKLLSINNIQPLQVIPTTTSPPGGQSCANKDLEISDLKTNLTFYQSAYMTSQKAADNLRQLQSSLQNQVNELKQNVTALESELLLKDRVIKQLQQQQQQPTSSSVTMGGCLAPLGMQDGTIPNSAITSSESQAGRGPENARLDNGQGWYTNEKTDSRDYLQINLGGLFYVTKIATQGAPCCDVMVTNYTLQYSKDGATWREYQDKCSKTYFRGNTDTTSVVTHTLDSPVRAHYVRFNVKDFRRDGVSNYVGMRTELYGCSA